MSKNQRLTDKSRPDLGKVANDTNQTGDQEATQLNQGRRTPHSRSDREDQIGGSNQTQSRRTSAGVQHKP